MKNWPPNKAWTSKNKIEGQNYFVAINYGIDIRTYWVNLVSVADSKICFILNFDELNNDLLWIPGWQELENTKNDGIHSNNSTKIYSNGCLHPSSDSGLSIGSKKNSFRPWFS